MKSLIVFATILFSSFSYSGTWSINQHGLPVVAEDRDNQKVLGFQACKAEHMQLVLMDANLPSIYKGKMAAFKARIDDGPIYDLNIPYEVVGGNDTKEYLGLYIDLAESVYLDLIEGNYIRFAFKDERDNYSIYEKYSLIGFTSTSRIALLECQNNLDSTFLKKRILITFN